MLFSKKTLKTRMLIQQQLQNKQTFKGGKKIQGLFISPTINHKCISFKSLFAVHSDFDVARIVLVCVLNLYLH